jgi:hypothetical protein
MMEDFKWVNAIIESCKLPQHLEYVPTILDLFDKKHQDDDATSVLNAMYMLKKQAIG